MVDVKVIKIEAVKNRALLNSSSNEVSQAFLTEEGAKEVGLPQSTSIFTKTASKLDAQEEAAFSLLYQIDIGEQAAKTRLLTYKDRPIGNASIGLNEFKEYWQLSRSKYPYKSEVFELDALGTIIGFKKVSGLANLLMSAWLYAEDDFHCGNFGVAKNAQGDLQWSQFAIAQGIVNVLSSGSTANPGQSITFSGAGGATNTFGLTGSSANNSNEVKATGGNVEINSVSNDVVITGGGNLVLQNTGLGTPVSGDYLVADGVTGKAIWETDPKAFVTLTGSPTWVIRDGYNATWNIGAGSLTLSITAVDGDSGTLIVINNGGEITWPANSNWPDATEPTLTAAGTDVFSFIYDGTNYYWSFGQNFGA